MGFSLAVPRFGFEPTICLARPILVEALECFERGDHIGAGVRLRESITRFLSAALEWYAVELPPRVKKLSKYPRPSEMAKALRQAKVLDRWAYTTMIECIDVGNAAAHCQPFDVHTLRGAIGVLFAQIDSEPFASMKDRPPIVATFDADNCSEERDEDDDGAGWWKKGGAV